VETGVWIIYDIIAAAIIIGAVVSNAKRGFSRIFISAMGYLVSCVLASSLSNAFAPQFYDLFLKDRIIEDTSTAIRESDISEEIQGCISDMTYGLDISVKDISRAVGKSDGKNIDKVIYNLIVSRSAGAVSSEAEVTKGLEAGITDSIRKIFRDKVPESMLKGLTDATQNSIESVSEFISVMFSGSADEAAEYIEEHYIRQCAVTFVKILLFIMILFILMIIVKIIENMLVQADKIPVIGRFDMLAGGIFGAVEAMALVFIACIIVKFIILLTDGTQTFLNEDTIEQSKLFSIFYNFDLFG